MKTNSIDVCLAWSSFIFLMYAIAGIIVGIYGYSNPCNRYAQANITWCGPAPDLGVFNFDICYKDDQNKMHTGEIISSQIACTAASYEQHLTICYELQRPGNFQNSTVGFENPAIAPAFMISGLCALLLAVLSGCFSRTCIECCCDNDFRRNNGYNYNNNDTMSMMAIATVATSHAPSGPMWTVSAHHHG